MSDTVEARPGTRLVKDLDWELTGLILLCADAVARGLCEPIIDRVLGAGLRPVGYRVLRIGPSTLDRLWEYNIGGVWHTYYFRMLDRVFALAPSMAVLLELDDGARPPHDRLMALKGSGRPGVVEPGTIRGDLGINQLLSLVHTPGEPDEARHDGTVLIGPDTPVGAAGADVRAEVLDACRLLGAAAHPDPRGFPSVLASLRARVVARLWHDLPERCRRWLLDAGLGDGGAGGALAGQGFGAGLRERWPGAGGHPLTEVLDWEFRPGASQPPHDELEHRLAAHAIHLDPWEALVLVSSSVFAPTGNDHSG
jgi:nucleoside diphosphate kinase